MTRWLAILPLVVLAALALLFAGYALRHDPHVNPDALVGKPTPTIALPTLDGGAPKPLAAYVEGPTLINVFASWCAPCIVENPALLALKSQGVRIIGVAYKDGFSGTCSDTGTGPACDSEATRQFITKLGDPFTTILVDQSGRAGVELGISGVPETFLVAPGGVIIAKHTGPLEPKDAEALLEKASASSGATVAR